MSLLHFPPGPHSAGQRERTPAAALHPGPGRLVKDAPTRVAHAGMALSFLVAYLTAEGEAWRLWHVIAGYVLLLALAFRLAWAVVGPPSARFTAWWLRLRAGWQWLAAHRHRVVWQEWRRQPAARLRQALAQLSQMVIPTLLVLSLAAGLSGWFVEFDWASESMAEWHDALGNALLVFVLLHLALLLTRSLWQRQNLMAVMWSGRLPGRGPDLVPSHRNGLAWALALSLIAFAAWYWWQAQASLL